MPVSSSENGGTVKLTITGRFDFNDHSSFRDGYKGYPGNASYNIDMSSTDYMDSSALGMLLLLREHAGGDNAKITISGCKPEIKKILSIANFQKLFEIK
jgi:anti-anti-sigma factor